MIHTGAARVLVLITAAPNNGAIQIETGAHHGRRPCQTEQQLAEWSPEFLDLTDARSCKGCALSRLREIVGCPSAHEGLSRSLPVGVSEASGTGQNRERETYQGFQILPHS